MRSKQELRLTAIEVYGGKCNRCPAALPACLDFHHVHGVGSYFRGAFGPKRHLLDVIKRVNTGVYELLCANCHRIEHAGIPWWEYRRMALENLEGNPPAISPLEVKG